MKMRRVKKLGTIGHTAATRAVECPVLFTLVVNGEWVFPGMSRMSGGFKTSNPTKTVLAGGIGGRFAAPAATGSRFRDLGARASLPRRRGHGSPIVPLGGAQHFQAFCRWLVAFACVRSVRMATECRPGQSPVTSARGRTGSTEGGQRTYSSFPGETTSATCQRTGWAVGGRGEGGATVPDVRGKLA